MFYRYPRRCCLDWTLAIEKNKAALAQVLDEIFGLLELALNQRLPRGLYIAVERLLRPAESALRRLIVIAARDVVLKTMPPRPMPEGLTFVRTRTDRPGSFQLFDPRKTFDDVDAEDGGSSRPGAGPHVHSIESFLASRVIAPPPTLDIGRLSRRFAILKHALDTLPRQAKRLARWHMRRATLEKARFRHALRPGPAPGSAKRPQNEAQRVLRECHALAHYALQPDTS
jgi:hypothetical protein